MDSRTRVTTATRESNVVAFLLDQVGDNYVFGAAGPNTFDCSGLVMRALERCGLKLPHNAAAQANFFRQNESSYINARLGPSYLVPGDVVFWYSIKAPTHCGIYIGRSNIGQYMVVSAVNEYYGVKKHSMRWALHECSYGLTHNLTGGSS